MTISASQALIAIPPGLRDPLLSEYQSIVQNFLERRWLPSELSGGRFSEIAYTILDGYANGAYATGPAKPANFLQACRTLENKSHVPRSFQILIPRLLPALYEIRNNRNVGHVGGDVDPNHMDSAAVLSICNWVMAELVRVFHGLSIVDAQKVVDALAEIRLPIIWSNGNIKRILDTKLKLSDQLLLFAATSVPDITAQRVLEYTEYKDKKYFFRTVRRLHAARFIEFNETADTITILPPGAKRVQDLVRVKKLGRLT